MMQFIEAFYANPLLKFLVDTTLKNFVIFAVVGVLAFYFRHKSAAVRCFVWGMAIVGCLIVSLFSLILPKWELGILPEAPTKHEVHQSEKMDHSLKNPISKAPSQLPTETEPSTPVTPAPSQPKVGTSRNEIPWAHWIGIVWAGVGLFFLARLIVGIVAVRRISARAHDFNSAIEQLHPTLNQQIRVCISDKITVPMVWGLFRPIILLPPEAANWQTQRLRAVMLHETAHIKRWDWLMQTITQITCAVYWFNPLVWFASQRIRTEAERACDDQVLNAGYQSTDYAQHLLEIVRNVKTGSSASQAAVTMVRSSKIEGRLRTVLAENLNRHPLRKVTVELGMLILTCFAVPIGAIRLTEAANTEKMQHQQVQVAPKSQSTPELFPPKPGGNEQISDPEQNAKNVEICMQNLLVIGEAIQTYRKEHGDFPEWLSDLYPKYLPDASILLCPADTKGGKPIFFTNTDPKMPVSYGYQFHSAMRKRTEENISLYGDVIPLARCRHHRNQPFECLNLGFSFKIYSSPGTWQSTPEDMYESIEKAITAIEAGIQKQPDNERCFYAYRSLVRLYVEVGREKDVEELINLFESVIHPADLDAHFLLGNMLNIANQQEKRLKVFEKLEKRYPDNHLILDELAQIHQELGNSARATEYQKKADPIAELVGKVVPDFSATALDGKPISLQQYRGKVVLLDFWVVWCGPNISEMPNVKRVYHTYKDQGFDIIGISLDTDETRLRNYLKANDIPWRQIFSGQKWNSPLAKQYHIHSIPAPWLIARDGTLISREARGAKLEQLVVETLKNK